VGPAPSAPVGRRATVSVRNTGRLPAYLSSHFPLEWASPTLELPRDEVAGGRLDLPAGASVRIPPGERVELEVVWP
jgi:urease subunit gamma/beta